MAEEEEDSRVVSSSPSRPPCNGGCCILLGLTNRPQPNLHHRCLGGRRLDHIISRVFVYPYRSCRKEAFIFVIRRFQEGRADVVQEEEVPSVFVVIEVLQYVVVAVRTDLWS